ncbi:MAG: hypothetical protein PHV59_06095 [Victivallales bacterium]|nr:hypothetical protein [Victivallales bacterium]
MNAIFYEAIPGIFENNINSNQEKCKCLIGKTIKVLKLKTIDLKKRFFAETALLN